MTSLATGLNTNSRACLAACQSKIYYANDFDAVKCWNGLTAALQDSGITGPSLVIGAPTAAAGGFDNGNHLIRYRYKDSKSGYVSNPSPALSYTVAGGNGSLTFGIGVADDIRPTTDPKVDQYIVEATAVGGGRFYQCGVAAVGAASVVVGQADITLIQQFNSDANYGYADNTLIDATYSSAVPPLGTILVPYRGRMWVLGTSSYPLTNCVLTATTTVTGTGFSLQWAGRIFTASGDAVSYQIASVTNSTTMILTVAYAGTPRTANATVVSQFPNRGYYSRLFLPEQFLPNSWARDFLANKNDQVRAAVGRKDGLYVFGLYSSERLIFGTDPAATAGAVLSPIQGKRGAWHTRVVVDVEGELYSWDRQGMWIVSEVPKHISNPIDPLMETLCDFASNASFHASFDPTNRTVMFFFVKPGDTVPKYAAVFEIDTGRWWFDTWLQGITASAVVPSSDGQVRLMLGDENGYSWYYGYSGSFDGVPPTSSAVVTVTGSPSTTVIPVTQALPTGSPTLAGVMLYAPSTGEAKVIASNTGTTITLASALAAAPAVNAELYLGPIQFEYRSKWWVGPGQEVRKAELYTLIKLFPGSSTGTMRIYYYADFATAPSPITSWPLDTQPAGIVTPTNGQNYLEANLNGNITNGFLSVPVPVEWTNTVQIRITSIRPDGELRILDVQFYLKKSETVDDVGT
jgi:hypothetical protein